MSRPHKSDPLPLRPSGGSGDHTGGPRRFFAYFLTGEKVWLFMIKENVVLLKEIATAALQPRNDKGSGFLRALRLVGMTKRRMVGMTGGIL